MRTDRIFTVCHITQLMVVLHLRRHLGLPKAREFLIWHPYDNSPMMVSLMGEIVAHAGFEDTLDMRDFESLRDRSHSALAWVFESARRLRSDALSVREWLAKNNIDEASCELWADDPIHFNVIFLKGLLRFARQVKFPHCFNLEDKWVPAGRIRLEEKMRRVSWFKRNLFWPLMKRITGVDRGPDSALKYDRSYSFDAPSPWSAHSVDISHLISMEMFRQSYESLPLLVRSEAERTLEPAVVGKRPLVLLLLFGFDSKGRVRQIYQQSISRIFSERWRELKDCTLAVKVHPGSVGNEEEALFESLRNSISARIVPLRIVLNLEFILPQLNPDFVFAGPCGALPIVKRLGAGKPVVIREVTEEACRILPEQRDEVLQFVQGMDAW